MGLSEREQALAERIDRDLAFLAPERSVGEYLIEKGWVGDEGVPVGHSELIERFREALMAEHGEDWDMDTVSEAAHVCAAAIGRWSVLRAAM